MKDPFPERHRSRYDRSQIPLPNTTRHHGVNIPRKMIVRTMRGQFMFPLDSPEWIEYVPR